jgi:glucose/arabinose dehydrogenase/sugar phosphate isomerase/epimerase
MTALLPSAAGAVASRLPEAALVSGLAVGATSRSFEPLSLFESIDRVHRAGAALLEIEMGQTLRPGQPELTVQDDLPDSEMADLKQKVSVTTTTLLAARVRFSRIQSANDRLFQWAERLRLRVLVGEPTDAQLDDLEKLIRSYNIQVAVWVGGPARRDNPIDPQTIMRRLRGRDARLGVTLNLPDLVRAGIDPFEALTQLRTRLIGIEVSDLSGLTPSARLVAFGTGVFDFRRLLTHLDAQRFDGYILFDWPGGTAGFEASLEKGLAFFREEMAEIRRTNLLRLASRSVRTPSGLRYEVLAQGDIPEPVHVALGPDGNIWFASRRGHLWTWSEATRSHRLITEFRVVTTGQRGLYSFAFDPGFITNGFLYVYRAPMLGVGNSNRVSRFTARRVPSGWEVDAASEKVLIDLPSAHHGQCQGGGFLFDPVDDCLYVGVGDNNLPSETAHFFDDPANGPQDLASPWGKILRFRPDGTVPEDNPFASRAGALPAVYAMGLRNPFSLTWDPATSHVYAGDVGYDRRIDQEEVNLIRPGANYGWPRCDGRGLDTLAGTACPLEGAVPPWFRYAHQAAAAVVVGPFFSPQAPSSWPPEYGRGFFHGDIARHSIRFAQVDPVHNAVTNTISLVSGLAGGPASMVLGADDALYFVEYAGWLAGHPRDRLSRIIPERQPSLSRPEDQAPARAGDPSRASRQAADERRESF